jgi:sortase A
MLATLVCVLLILCFPRLSAAAPTFTGDAAADFTGSNAARIADIEGDVGMPAPDFPAGSISGWDMRAIYLEYDPVADVLYVGIDCIVICGDADNDGDPNTTGPILGKPVSDGGLGGQDIADWGRGEAFGLLIDTNNDFDGVNGDFEVVVGIRNSATIAEFGAYVYTGRIGAQLRNTGWGEALPNTVALFAPTGADVPDLEFTIADFSTLPGFNGAVTSYKVHAAMGSIVDDGIGEDFAPNQSAPVEVTPTPTNTPTSTPLPTETPTATPTNTLVPTEPPTNTPTATPTNTLVPTEPPTNTPTPSPTPTVPPPTSVPTTGADLSWQGRGQWIEPEIAVNETVHGPMVAAGQPSYLEIPSLQLFTAVESMGWDRAISSDGEVYSRWDEIHFAAGWLQNSAAPGATGNVVLTGHNNVYGAVFRDLWRLKPGEPVLVHAAGQRYRYIVDQVIVRPEVDVSDAQRAVTASYITQTADQRLTLVTCWPPNSNTHRVFVEAHLATEAAIGVSAPPLPAQIGPSPFAIYQ